MNQIMKETNKWQLSYYDIKNDKRNFIEYDEDAYDDLLIDLDYIQTKPNIYQKINLIEFKETISHINIDDLLKEEKEDIKFTVIIY